MPRHTFNREQIVDTLDQFFKRTRPATSAVGMGANLSIENEIEEVIQISSIDEKSICEKKSYFANISEKSYYVLLLISILMFEGVVCLLGSQFYETIGYSVFVSIVLAVSGELFYMYFSTRKDQGGRVLKLILLSVSVSILSYSAYVKDENVANKRLVVEESLRASKRRLLEVDNELANLKVEQHQIDKDMESYRKFDKITKGNMILAPRREEIRQRRESLLLQRNELKNESNAKGEELVKQSFFSNISILTIKTIISIIVFTVLQIAISFVLPDVFEKLKSSKV